MCGSPVVRALSNPFAGVEAIANNPGLKTITGAYTPGPSAEEQRAMIEAPVLARQAAETAAAQATNAKLAARNRRRGASLLATGAGDTGALQGQTASKTVLGA